MRFHSFEAISSRLQLLNRIDGMHRTLEREVDVAHLKQEQGLID